MGKKSPPARPDRSDAANEMVTADLEIDAAGQTLAIAISVPAGKVPSTIMVPVARDLAAAFIARATAVVAAAGKTVSCRRGCAACCRQLAGLSIAEARAIHDVVDAMPEEQRSAIRARFAALHDGLAAAGLLDLLRAPHALAEPALRDLAARYFRLRPACPFLEDEACSIYADRPLACRHHLVTSPPEYCDTYRHPKVEGVPRLARVTGALIASDPEAGLAPDVPATWVPLPMLLDWVARHPAPEPQETGPELLTRFLSLLFGRDVPRPDDASGPPPMIDTDS